MTRLRYTLAEAKQAATDIAIEALGPLNSNHPARIVSVSPDHTAPQGIASKHPTRWIVAFVCHDPEVAVDGGETFISVDLETRTGEVVR